MSVNKNLVIILGPTAVGKSSLAVRLARLFQGEIINCDSMQVYRGFDIGTDKPSPEARREVPHHLLDIAEPTTQFTAADFVQHARQALEEISSRGNLPFIVGGTGLYLRALIQGLFPGPGRNPALRRQLEEEGRLHGFSSLWERLLAVDPEYGRKIHPHDRGRIIRALEVYLLTGKPLSDHFRATKSSIQDFQTIKIGLKLEKDLLYRQIEERVDRMFARGIIQEVQNLLSSGVSEDAPPFQALGYHQVLRYLRGEITREEAIALTKKETRQYAKRQMTWFRKMEGITWFNPADYEKIVCFIKDHLKS